MCKVLLLISSLLIFFVECRIHQSNLIGGEGGTARAFDDIAENRLQNGDVPFYIRRILLAGVNTGEAALFRAMYTVSRLGAEQTIDGRVAGAEGITLVIANASLVISLSDADIVTRMYGYYAPIARFGGLFGLNTLGFDILRSDGTSETFVLGTREGFSVSAMVGPIVGFYGNRGAVIDGLGAYVDTSLWPNRPSRLLMLRAGGRTFGDGSEDFFDHNVELGEPFVVRIARLDIYYDSNNVHGLYVVYEDHLRNRIPIMSGNTTGRTSQNVSVIFELGDYITTLEINGNVFINASLCLAGMQLVVFRAATGAVETITAGTIDLTTVIRLRGPIVAFHGLSRGSNDGACIARLGGHRLLHSSELPRACLLPTLTGNALLSNVQGPIGVDRVLTVSCRNTSLVAVSGTTMRCREDGIWDREELDCRVSCPLPVAPSNGYFLNIPETITDNVTVVTACNAGYSLTSGGILTCMNGVLKGQEPQCTNTSTDTDTAGTLNVPVIAGIAGGAGAFCIIFAFVVGCVLGVITHSICRRKCKRSRSFKRIRELSCDAPYGNYSALNGTEIPLATNPASRQTKVRSYEVPLVTKTDVEQTPIGTYELPLATSSTESDEQARVGGYEVPSQTNSTYKQPPVGIYEDPLTTNTA